MPRTSSLTIPYTGVPTVESTPYPHATQDITASPNAFGAGVGQAMQGFGQALGQLGDTLGAVEEKNKNEINEASARNIDTDMTKKMIALQTKYGAMSEQDAIDYKPTYDKEAAQILADARKAAAGNKAVGRMIDRSTAQKDIDQFRYGLNHLTQQAEKANDSAGQARINGAIDASTTAQTPEKLQETVGVIEGEITSWGKRRGKSQAEVDVKRGDAVSQAYSNYITFKSINDPDGAEAFYLQNKDKITDSKLRIHIEGTIQKRKEDKETGAAIDGAVNGGARPPIPTPAPPKANIKLSDANSLKGLVQLASMGNSIPYTSAYVEHPPVPGAAPGYVATKQEVSDYIINAAKVRGIDPEVALKVYYSEGSTNWKSTVKGEDSWGPYQLYTGDGKGRTGLGNELLDNHGIDPRNPESWKHNIDFALNKAVEGGWGPWNGAKAVGIFGKHGIRPDARTIPLDATTENHFGNRQLMSYIQTRQKQEEGSISAKPMGGRVTEAQSAVAGIRKLPLVPQLKSALEAAADVAGVRIRVTSGGQPGEGRMGVDRTGSHRHDHGNAADVDILDDDGKKLARNDPRRLAFLEAAAKFGAGGIGAGYMDDNLKVHVGITGASGREGEGLGAYAGNAEERAAVAAGLGQADPGMRYARGNNTPVDGGKIRLASLGTGTVSDAPSPEATARLPTAQGLDTLAMNPPDETKTEKKGDFWEPMTADTPVAEVEARAKYMEELYRAQGKREMGIKVNQGIWAQFEKMKAIQKKKEAEAFEEIKTNLYGNRARGIKPATNMDEILKDPKMFDIIKNKMDPDDVHKMEKIVESNFRQSIRQHVPTAEDEQLYRDIRAVRIRDPNEYRDLDLFKVLPPDYPQKLRDKMIAEQREFIRTGGTAEDNARDSTVKSVGKTILDQVQIKEKSKKGEDFLGKLDRAVEAEEQAKKRRLTKEEIEIEGNKLMKKEAVEKGFLGIRWGNPQREFEKQPPVVPKGSSESDLIKRAGADLKARGLDVNAENVQIWLDAYREKQKGAK